MASAAHLAGRAAGASRLPQRTARARAQDHGSRRSSRRTPTARNRDLLIAGALLHDIGKLEELTYDIATDYSVEGNLLGHIAIGAGMLRDVAAGIEGFPADLRSSSST